MYLSRVEIDLRNWNVRRELSHLGAYHNWVERSFTEKFKDGNRPRHLWRIDILHGKTYLLVLSEEKPDEKRLSRYGIAGTVMIKKYDAYLDKLSVGELLQFRLTANPSHKITVSGKKQGRVVPHITIDQQKRWLLDRMKKNGFEIINKEDGNKNFDIVSREWKTLYHKQPHRVRLSCVSFEGVLKITDLSKFKNALTQGIGREKAYGMGLLTVIPR